MKTESVLEYFKANPNREFSPMEVSRTLGLDSRLVASVLCRLVARGILARTARGKYKYPLEVPLEREDIIRDARTMLSNSIGEEVLRRMGLDQEFKDLTYFLTVMRQRLGSRLANSLLRQAILKNCKAKDARALMNQLGL